MGSFVRDDVPQVSRIASTPHVHSKYIVGGCPGQGERQKPVRRMDRDSVDVSKVDVGCRRTSGGRQTSIDAKVAQKIDAALLSPQQRATGP